MIVYGACCGPASVVAVSAAPDTVVSEAPDDASVTFSDCTCG